MGRYPLLLAAALALASLGLAWALPMHGAWPAALAWLGVLLVALGLALLVVSAGAFRRRGTTVDPTRAPDRLVTDGLYRVSRNPMYLGMLLALVGLQALLASPLGLVFALGFFLYMDRVRIPAEEGMVAAVFGEAYQRYRQATRRWFGWR